MKVKQQKAHRLQAFNNEIDKGLEQLARGEKISADKVFNSIFLKKSGNLKINTNLRSEKS